jgi:hypothetical protein
MMVDLGDRIDGIFHKRASSHFKSEQPGWPRPWRCRWNTGFGQRWPGKTR